MIQKRYLKREGKEGRKKEEILMLDCYIVAV